MKNRQLLSIAFSLIMITGASANSAAYGQSNDLEEIDNILEDFCELNTTEKAEFFTEYPEYAQYDERLASICDIEDENEREDALDAFIDEVIPETRDDHEDESEDETEMEDNDTMYENLDDKLEHFCELTDEERSDLLDMISDLPDNIREKLTMFCDMTEDEQRDLLDSLSNRMDEFNEQQRMIIREMQDRHKEIREHNTEYERFCKMSPEERNVAIDDPEKLSAVSEWCDMTPEERDAYKMEHHAAAMDAKEKRHDALERMKENRDLSHRLREMVLDEDGYSDKQISELKEKIKEKSQEHEKKKSELKEKFRENKSELKFRFSELSDIRKSEIKERHKEMKEFKTELRLKSDSLTDEEKQELRAEFIEQVKDMQLAWITPRDQISAGIEPDQIECREGYSLVMKNSNGLPMCVTAKTAIKMIEKGYAVPIEPAN